MFWIPAFAGMTERAHALFIFRYSRTFMKHSNKQIKRLTAFVLTIALSVTQIIMPTGAGAASSLLAPPISLKTLKIPAELGTVEEVFEGNKREFVVLLQDAHANLSAQESIASLIDHLSRELNISLLAEEGAEGKIDTMLLRAIPAKEAVKEVLDRYVRRGKLNGAEFYAATSEKSTDFVGVDKRKLYLKNLSELLTVLSIQDQALKSVRSVRTATKTLEDVVYAEPLLALNKLLARQSSDKIEFGAFLLELRKHAEQAGMELARFKQLEKITNANIDITQLKNINASEIHQEIEVLTLALKAHYAKTSAEQTLLRLDEYVSLLERGFKLELSRSDVSRLEKLHQEFSEQEIQTFLSAASTEHHIKFLYESPEGVLDRNYERVADFYRTAAKRDAEISKLLLNEMDRRSLDGTILVAGGFHREGITGKLRSKGISYAVISPRITELTSHEDYLRIMEENRSLIENESVIASPVGAPFMAPGESGAMNRAPTTALSRNDTLSIPSSLGTPELRPAFLSRVLSEVLQVIQRDPVRYGFSGANEVARAILAELEHQGIMVFPELERAASREDLIRAASRAVMHLDYLERSGAFLDRAAQKNVLVSAVRGTASRISRLWKADEVKVEPQKSGFGIVAVREATLPLEEVRELNRFAHFLMDRAKNVVGQQSGKRVATDRKIDGSLVTAIDRNIQQIVVEEILKRFPKHHIIAEEKIEDQWAKINRQNAESAEYVWVLDPIDGTREFTEGSNFYGTPLALYYKGLPVLAMVRSPEFGIIETSLDREGVYINDMPVSMDESETLPEHFSAVIPGITEHPAALRDAVRKEASEQRIKKLDIQFMTRSVVVNSTNIIRNKLDLFSVIQSVGMSIWDVGAVAYLVEKAGGKFFAYENDKLVPLLELLEKDISTPGRREKKYQMVAGTRAAMKFVEPLLEQSRLASLEKPLPPSIPHVVPEAVSLPSSIENITHREIPKDKPIAVVMDVHGTLLKQTWKIEYAEAYRRLAGGDLETAKRWVDENARKDLNKELQEASKKSEKEVLKVLKFVREKLWRTQFPELMPGAYEFVKALREKNIPVIFISGSKRRVIIPQLREHGFLDLVPEEMVVSRDDMLLSSATDQYSGRDRNRAILSLKNHFPNYTFVHFNDWVGGIKAVRALDGFTFSLPQGEGEEWNQNREILVNRGADFVTKNGLADWAAILKYISVPFDIQRPDYVIPTSDGPATEIPYVLPSPRRGGLKLHIDVSDDLRWVTYSEVVDDSAVYRRDGSMDYGELRLRKIATFPSSYLMSPVRYIENNSPPDVLEAVGRLWPQHKRYTRYRGLTVSWDRDTDRDVWTSNIDTFFFHNRLENSDLLETMKIERSAEIGVGGGHLTNLLVSSIPNLREHSMTDISMYALRTAKRGVMPFLSARTRLRTFLGKGLGKLGKNLDLLLINPPYIPTSPFDTHPATDPYRGTGLIREALVEGPNHLNSKNPEASIVINVSSLAAKDLERYIAEFQKLHGEHFVIELLGEPLKVPLKIRTISQEWKDWLVAQGLLEFHPDARLDEEPYWHTLQLYRIHPRPESSAGFGAEDKRKRFSKEDQDALKEKLGSQDASERGEAAKEIWDHFSPRVARMAENEFYRARYFFEEIAGVPFKLDLEDMLSEATGELHRILKEFTISEKRKSSLSVRWSKASLPQALYLKVQDRLHFLIARSYHVDNISIISRTLSHLSEVVRNPGKESAGEIFLEREKVSARLEAVLKNKDFPYAYLMKTIRRTEEPSYDDPHVLRPAQLHEYSEGFTGYPGDIFIPPVYEEVEGSPDPAAALDERSPEVWKEVLKQAMANLTEEEATVIHLLFGLDGGEKRTLEETGLQIGKTKERARQISLGAFQSMRYILPKMKELDAILEKFKVSPRERDGIKKIIRQLLIEEGRPPRDLAVEISNIDRLIESTHVRSRHNFYSYLLGYLFSSERKSSIERNNKERDAEDRILNYELPAELGPRLDILSEIADRAPQLLKKLSSIVRHGTETANKYVLFRELLRLFEDGPSKRKISLNEYLFAHYWDEDHPLPRSVPAPSNFQPGVWERPRVSSHAAMSPEREEALINWVQSRLAGDQPALLPYALEGWTEHKIGKELGKGVLTANNLGRLLATLRTWFTFGILDQFGSAEEVFRVLPYAGESEFERLFRRGELDKLVEITRGDAGGVIQILVELYGDRYGEREIEEVAHKHFNQIFARMDVRKRKLSPRQAINIIHYALTELDPERTPRKYIIKRRALRDFYYPLIRRQIEEGHDHALEGLLRELKSERSLKNREWKELVKETLDYFQPAFTELRGFYEGEAPHKEPLLPYQYYSIRDALEALSRPERSALLAGEARLGKTIIAILTAFNMKGERSSYAVKRVLYTTKNQAKYEVAQEIKRRTTKELDLKVVVLDGTPQEKLKALEEARKHEGNIVLVVNYEFVRDHAEELKSFKPDLHIIDELDNLRRGEDTLRAPIIFSIPSTYRIGISAQPVVKRSGDIVPTLLWLRHQTFESEDQIKKLSSEEIFEALDPIMVRWRRKIVLPELGDPEESIIHIPYGELQDRILRRIRAQFSEWKSEEARRDKADLVDHIFQRVDLERRASVDLALVLPEEDLPVEELSTKIQKLDELIDQELKEDPVSHTRGKVLILVDFVEEVERLESRYNTRLGNGKAAGVSGKLTLTERNKRIWAFRSEHEPSVLIGTPKLLGSSLNLFQIPQSPFHISTLIRLSRPWINMNDGERLIGIGQTHPVKVITLVSQFRDVPVAADSALLTVDEMLEKQLSDERTFFRQIVDGVDREMLETGEEDDEGLAAAKKLFAAQMLDDPAFGFGAEGNVRVAMAQINPRVGDLTGNYQKILENIQKAEEQDADLVVTPELAMTGYPPEDLLYGQHFLRQNKALLRLLIRKVKNITAVVGFVDFDKEGKIYNAAAVISNGELKGIYRKRDLPNYKVFDEKRYFEPGEKAEIVDMEGNSLGKRVFTLGEKVLCVNVCEDIWMDGGVFDDQIQMGARLIINTSASPYRRGVDLEREEVLKKRVAETGSTIVYTNAVGGQDVLVFDGGSLIMNEKGEIIIKGKEFEEELIVTDVPVRSSSPTYGARTISLSHISPAKEKKLLPSRQPIEHLNDIERIYRAVVLATRDYVGKTGFKKVLFGNSGGLDSAVVGAIARDALGAENVEAISMPSRFNSKGTKSDARELAANLGIAFKEIPIQTIFFFILMAVRSHNFLSKAFAVFFYGLSRLFRSRYLSALAEKLLVKCLGVPEENLQARARGMVLMFLSNVSGAMLLTTSNKSEAAVGYTTLYGDMTGGFAPIQDVLKTQVFELARYINRLHGREIIPESIITREPSAELNVGQKDQDTLPPYSVLDEILKAFLEENESIEQMAQKWDRNIVEWVVNKVDQSEYKRRQGPPGVKVSKMYLGRERRMPISNGYREVVTERFLRTEGAPKKVGIFGGTFNPIHTGHIKAVEAVRKQLGLDEIVFVPSRITPDRQVERALPPEERFYMAQLATKGNPYFRVSSFEINQAGPSYTIDTVRHLREEYPEGSEFFLIMGEDRVPTLETWKDIGELSKMTSIVSMSRPGHPTVSSPRVKHVVTWEGADISSGEIRRRLSSGLSISNLVPKPVEDYIRSRIDLSTELARRESVKAKKVGVGLVVGKFSPFHDGHEGLLRAALDQAEKVILVIYDHPELSNIPAEQMAELIKNVMDNDRLEIKIAYDYPPTGDTPEARQAHVDYLKKLTGGVKVDKFFGNEWYSKHIAEGLGAELVQPDPKRKQVSIAARDIRRDLKLQSAREFLHPVVRHRIDQPGTKMWPVSELDRLLTEAADTSSLEKLLGGNEKDQHVAQLLGLNPNYPDRDKLLGTMKWDVGQFERPHRPVVVGEIRNKKAFSEQRGIRILDMAIRMPGKDEGKGWALPKALEPYREVLELAVRDQKTINPDFDENDYVYITVDQKKVEPGKTQRRAGWHGDAFVTPETSVLFNEDGSPREITTDTTYVIADELPTLFLEGPFSLKGIDAEDSQAVLKHFDERALELEESGQKPQPMKPYTLVRITPYDLHSVNVNQSDKTLSRTFVKIQFSKDKLNRVGNKVNRVVGKDGKPLLDYSDWIWVKRDPTKRNTRNSIINWDRPDRDQFRLIDAKKIDITQDTVNVPWAKSKFIYATKIEAVRAELAAPDEILETKMGTFVETLNIAQQGDWKITTSQGDQYFLSAEKFKRFYEPDPQREGFYLPKKRVVKMLEITEPIRLRAPWSAMQYMPAGSKLAFLSEDDFYAIHPKNFEASYVRTDKNGNLLMDLSLLDSDAKYIAWLNNSIRNGVPVGYPWRSLKNTPTYTAPTVLSADWADIDISKLEGQEKENQLRIVRERALRIDPSTKFENGLPKNSRETGLNGRGLLGVYGPNQAEDPVLLRYNQQGEVEVLVIDRMDSGATRLPGGFSERGQELEFGITATREAKEETFPKSPFKVDFTKGALVFQGQVHTIRDTNDAWIVTRGIAVILSYEQSLNLSIEASDDARPGSARFVSVDSEQLKNLGTHSKIIAEAVRRARAGEITIQDDILVPDAPLAGFGATVELKEEELVPLLQKFQAAFLFIGHGSKAQYKDANALKRKIDGIVDKLNRQFGTNNWLAIFGGDPANKEKPDIGFAMHYLATKHNVPILAAQADEYKKYGVGDHVTYAYYYPTQRNDSGQILYGGVRDGKPVGSTATYLSDAFIQNGLKGIIALGGGPIAKEEIDYARKKGLEVEYHPFEVRHAEGTGPYGVLHDAIVRRTFRLSSEDGKTRVLDSELSNRSRRHFKFWPIEKLRWLADKKESDLLAIPYFGIASLRELKIELAKHSLSLKPPLLEDIGLYPTTMEALKSLGIDTLEKLTGTTETELRAHSYFKSERHLGAAERHLGAVRYTLYRFGRKLKQESGFGAIPELLQDHPSLHSFYTNQEVPEFERDEVVSAGDMTITFVKKNEPDQRIHYEIVNHATAGWAVRNRNDFKMGEAEALARLNQIKGFKGRIPKLLAVGVAEVEGRKVFWMKTESIEHADWLTHSDYWLSLSTIQKLDVLIEIAETVSLVHQAGFLHNYLDPQNFVLNEQGKVMLVNFQFASPIGSPFPQGSTRLRKSREDKRFFKSDMYDFSGAMNELLFWGGKRSANIPSEGRRNSGLEELRMGMIADDINDRKPETMQDVVEALKKARAYFAAKTGFGARTAEEIARENIARLNRERPEGYPERNFENPPTYTAARVIEMAKSRTNSLGWAHPNLDDPNLSVAERNRLREEIRADIKRFSRSTKFVNGMPRNRKETGLRGRGLLGRYGPNPAEDPVILRHNEKGELEVLTIERGDGVAGRALPGAMIQWGEETKTGVTASRALYDKTGIRLDLTGGMVVYEGAVDDWRDTNDAWVESRAVAKLLSWEESKYLKPEAGANAKENSAKWVRVDDPNNKFYARHGIIIANAVAKVMSGQLKSSDAQLAKKYPPLDITTRSLDEAYQAFRENRIQKETFDLIAPKAPHGGDYIVVAGLEETLGAIRRRRFTKEHIDQLRKIGRYSEKFLKYLSEFIFEGDIDALQEGRVVSSGIPILRIKASPIEQALLKDLIINRMAFSTNIATKTARIVQAANGEFVDEATVAKLIKEFGMTREQIKRFRAVLDFGQRRAQGRGATEASRAAVIGGAIATSNVKAAKMHYLEPSGTMAHFFIMLFPPDREIDAFRLYAKTFPHQTTLLVDTYDTIQGVRNAITVAQEMKKRGEELFGVRLDSGNLASLSRQVRKMLNGAGLHYVKIFASDDLDEEKITKLLSEGAELDGLGVGTNLITGGKQAYLELNFVKSQGERVWRSRHKGKIQRYVKTPAGRTAHAAYAEEIFELLNPIWRGGKRVFGVEKPWQAHLRTLNELNQWSPEHKKLQDSAKIPVETQDNPLSINPHTDAMLDVDVQSTFMPGGGLAVREGDLILPNVRAVMNLFPKERRFASVDRHPRGHMSLASSYEGYAPFTYLSYDEVSKWTEEDHRIAPHAKFTLAELKEVLKKTGGQVLWTDHAEEGTPEGELHDQLLEREYEYVQLKGMDPRVDSYSAFRDNMGNPTALANELRARGVKRLFVKGLAMDYCVGWSCEDAVKEGFEVFIIIDATRPVGFPEGSIQKMNESFKDKGIKVITAKELVDANNHMGVFPATVLPEPIAHPPVPEEDESSALEEDMYHLTMAQVIFNEGIHEKPATYDYFFRTPPYGDDKIIVSGIKFLMDEIRKFRFTVDDIEYLQKHSPYKFTPEFLDYLAHFEFKGDIDALPEGSVAFAREPIIRVKGTAFEIIMETLILKRINFNNLIATWSNLTRQKYGEGVRLNVDAVIGAQGQSHAEAMYSAFVGGINATTDLDAHLNYGVPLAWPEDEGVWLGSDFITGGPKAALGGVYKLAVFDGEGRIKLSEHPGKTSLPENKEIVEIRNSEGKVIRRVIHWEGKELSLNPGETAVRRLVPIMRGGKAVYTPPSGWEAQVFRSEDLKANADVHEAVLSEALAARQTKLIEQARSSNAQAGFGKSVSPQEEIINAVNEVVLDAARESMQSVGSVGVLVFSRLEDFERIEQRALKYKPELRAKGFGSVKNIVVGWDVSGLSAADKNALWLRISRIFSARGQRIFVGTGDGEIFSAIRGGIQAALLGPETDYLLQKVDDRYKLYLMQRNGNHFIAVVSEALRLAELAERVASISA